MSGNARLEAQIAKELARNEELEHKLNQLEALLLWIRDEQVYAVQADLENGVKWLNEHAAQKFGKEMPSLCKFLEEMADRIDQILENKP